MLTRRDALKLAALAAGGALPPFAASAEEAAALLGGPVAFDPGAGRPPVWGSHLLDPVAFADDIDGVDFAGDLFDNGAPVEMAAYKQALDALIDRYPELRAARADHPLTLLDEAALSMWSRAWMAGIRAGAAYEHLRLALVTPRMGCPRCHSHGKLWGGSPHRHHDDGTNEQTCPDCRGAGTVPMPAPTPPVLGLG